MQAILGFGIKQITDVRILCKKITYFSIFCEKV